MTLRFLIDNCLPPYLATLAIDSGYVESRHLSWHGQADLKDHSVRKVAVDGGYTLVTRNAVDFRGAREAPGSKGEFAKVPLHDGLVCLNGPSLDFDLAREMFQAALAVIEQNGRDMVNRVLEIDHKPETDEISYDLYEMPARF